MIIGIGTDIVEVSRFEKLICREHFMERVFTPYERSYIAAKTHRAAGMFGAKEAFSKAVGTGLSGFSLTDVEVRHDEKGKPFYCLSGRALEQYGHLKFHLSISHEKTYAVAFATASRE